MNIRVSLFSKFLSQNILLAHRGAFGCTNQHPEEILLITLNKKLRTALKVFAKRYIRSKFQSCQIWLKLKIQSLLTLLIPKNPILSILAHKCGSLSSNNTWLKSVCTTYQVNFHIYGSKLTKLGFLESVGSGGSRFLISAKSDNFEILTLCSAQQKL